MNVDGSYNVYEAAVENGLDRVVFASTNHVSHMYNAASADEPESLVEDPDVIDPDISGTALVSEPDGSRARARRRR